MKIGDLNVGDLLRFDYTAEPPDSDVGIVVEVEMPLVAVHWLHEQDHNPCWHDDSEMDEWLRDGLVEVINENR